MNAWLTTIEASIAFRISNNPKKRKKKIAFKLLPLEQISNWMYYSYFFRNWISLCKTAKRMQMTHKTLITHSSSHTCRRTPPKIFFPDPCSSRSPFTVHMRTFIKSFYIILILMVNDYYCVICMPRNLVSVSLQWHVLHRTLYRLWYRKRNG